MFSCVVLFVLDIICGRCLSYLFQILNVGAEAGELKAGTKVQV